MTLLAVSGRRRRDAEHPIPYTLPTAPPWNAPLPAIIPSPDGWNSAIHPGVVDFGPGQEWNGYRYWMGNTSFYNGNALFEDPYIVASHDGYHWENPPGISNPIQDATSPDFHSDTDLLYDPLADKLILLFRLNFGPRIMRSSDGVTWTGPETWSWPISGGPVSPSMVRISATEWWVWAVDANTTNPHRVLLYKSSTPTGPWTWQALTTPMAPGPLGPWHLDVMQDSDGVFRALCQVGDSTPGQTIWAASSLDGITWAHGAAPVISPSVNGWDNESLYRPTMTEHEDGIHFRVWYGGKQAGPLWLTGYTQIARSEWPTPPTP